MASKNAGAVHWSFWVIAVIALIWNGLGIINFFVQMNPEVIEAYRDSERAIIVGRPLWATSGFALAVFGGGVGAVLLLFRRSAAHYLFIASLLGVVVTMTHALGVDISFGVGEIVAIILLPIAVALYLIWYSKLVIRKGWVN